jgi:phage terminase large subunit-like protein
VDQEQVGISPDPAELRKIAVGALSAQAYRRKFSAIDYVNVYPKQRELFAAGATARERLLKAANQSGKSFAASLEISYHATGRYPPWWEGWRTTKPVRIWVCSETSILLRDVMQSLLFGPPGLDDDFGSGSVPLDLIEGRPSMARGITDAYDTVQVRHASGGISTIKFRSYQAGRKAFQGATLDLIVFDEEPPLDVYSEGVTRITATNGRALMIYTPMGGAGEVTRRFTDQASPDRALIKMTLYDVAVPGSHMTLEMVETIKRNCLPYEMKTRVYGEDMQGSGSIFPIDEEDIKEAPIVDVPLHWHKLWCIDFGINHPFAAVLMLYDADADCVHVHRAIRVKNQTPLQHAVPMKAIAAGVPVAWPHDGDNREAGTGESLVKLYRDQDLRMLGQRAQFEDGSISTERGLLEIYQRMTTGRFKVSSLLTEWFEEFRSYHRKDGQIVKLYDDLMSASRIGIMQLRSAKQGPIGSKIVDRRGREGFGAGDHNSPQAIHERNHFDLFTGV